MFSILGLFINYGTFLDQDMEFSIPHILRLVCRSMTQILGLFINYATLLVHRTWRLCVIQSPRQNQGAHISLLVLARNSACKTSFQIFYVQSDEIRRLISLSCRVVLTEICAEVIDRTQFFYADRKMKTNVTAVTDKRPSNRQIKRVVRCRSREMQTFKSYDNLFQMAEDDLIDSERSLAQYFTEFQYF